MDIVQSEIVCWRKLLVRITQPLNPFCYLGLFWRFSGNELIQRITHPVFLFDREIIPLKTDKTYLQGNFSVFCSNESRANFNPK